MPSDLKKFIVPVVFRVEVKVAIEANSKLEAIKLASDLGIHNFPLVNFFQHCVDENITNLKISNEIVIVEDKNLRHLELL